MNIFVRSCAIVTLFSALFILPFAVAPPAQAGILEFFFPSLRQDPPDPTSTLQAPFAYEGEKKKKALIEDGTKKLVPLDIPHRTSVQIAEWLTSVVSEVLTFEDNGYQASISSGMQYFDQTGYRAYVGFLEENKIKKILESEKFVMRSFVEDDPIVLNEGAVGGVYRWLFEVPVMISYMDRGMKDYAKSDVTTQHVTLTLQVGRNAKASDRGVVIEQWDSKVEKIISPKKK